MPQAPTKYHNVPVVLHGKAFDSKAEGVRYCQLLLLEQNDRISDLELQPKFLLKEGYRDRDGVWRRAILYIGDFSYLDLTADGRQVVEDVKGCQTGVFRLKRKLLQARYPDLVFTVLSYDEVLGSRRRKRG